jgi:hypothetical protein
MSAIVDLEPLGRYRFDVDRIIPGRPAWVGGSRRDCYLPVGERGRRLLARVSALIIAVAAGSF